MTRSQSLTALVLTFAATTIAPRTASPQDSSAELVVGTPQYPTIGSVYPSLAPGVKVRVLPGTYYEQLILVDRVDWTLDDGVVIDYNAAGTAPTVTDNGMPVTCTVRGWGVIRRSGSSAEAMVVSNDASVVTFHCREVIAPQVSWFAIRFERGTVVFRGDVTSYQGGINVRNANAEIYGGIDANKDYGLLGANMYHTVKAVATVTSRGNSAIHCSGGTMDFTGAAKGWGIFWGFAAAEHSGGTFTVRDATLINLRDREFEGDGLSKYGGLEAVLDNCAIWCKRANAYSLGTGGTNLNSVTIERPCAANRDKSPYMTINGGGTLTVDPLLPEPWPPSPVLLVPDAGETIADNTPTFDWGKIGDPNGTTYTLEVDDDAGFASPVISAGGLTNSDYTALAPLPDATYSWRIRATDGLNRIGPWSAIRTLKVSTLASITVSPSLWPVPKGYSRPFTVNGFDASGNPVPVVGAVWTASAGTIDSTGRYTAPNAGGLFTVTCAAGALSSSASARVPSVVLRGDANGDGWYDILDVAYLTDFVFRGGRPPAYRENGDLNGDKVFDILDVTLLTNIVFRGAPIPPPLTAPPTPLDEFGQPIVAASSGSAVTRSSSSTSTKTGSATSVK